MGQQLAQRCDIPKHTGHSHRTKIWVLSQQAETCTSQRGFFEAKTQEEVVGEERGTGLGKVNLLDESRRRGRRSESSGDEQRQRWG